MILELRSKWYKKPTKVEFYDGIQDLPITNYNDYQKLAAVAIGVGSTIQDFNSHIETLHSYVVNGKKDEAVNEMTNMLMGYYNTINGTGTDSLILLPFIKSVDGERYEMNDDMDNAKAMIKKLSDRGLTRAKLEELLGDVKKNLFLTLQQHFLQDSIVQERIMSWLKSTGKPFYMGDLQEQR